MLEDLRAVRGRALEVRDNILVLEVSRWRASGSWQNQRPALVVLLHLVDPDLSIGERRFSAGRTFLALVVLPAVVFTLAVALYLILIGPSENT